MSAYENVVLGKLKVKGKALDVKAGCIKKKKKHSKQYKHLSHAPEKDHTTGGKKELTNLTDGDIDCKQEGATIYDHRTPAERRYLEQWEKINLKRLAKVATKSHRDRIQEFNQYLANLSEHYDIPKVGPG